MAYTKKANQTCLRKYARSVEPPKFPYVTLSLFA